MSKIVCMPWQLMAKAAFSIKQEALLLIEIHSKLKTVYLKETWLFVRIKRERGRDEEPSPINSGLALTRLRC